ncbi:MAG: patatin-like phospholipase family protein [Alistipes sp.]|nr:patatin-like phospholipase family protein [Alistipes sp.]
MKKDVALVLSSGGPRGLAYIGAIEELLERGYGIHSVAGCSMGSLVGGVYAAGRLAEFKHWLATLDGWSVFSLMDLSVSKNHFVKGDKIMEAIKEIVPDVNIESLPIPYTAVATDLCTGEEVVFRSGKLFDAIRASISIPSLFRPVQHGMSLLIDGCMVNCLPLNHVTRRDGDILLAFDTNYMDVEAIRRTMVSEQVEVAAEQAFYEHSREQAYDIIDDLRGQSDQSMLARLRSAGDRAVELARRIRDFRTAAQNRTENDFGDTYMSIIDRSFSIMNHRQTQAMIGAYKPDITVRMSFDAYGDIADYAKVVEISEIGRKLMSQALDSYESRS